MPRKVRNYKAEYDARRERGLARGLTVRESLGHKPTIPKVRLTPEERYTPEKLEQLSPSYRGQVQRFLKQRQEAVATNQEPPSSMRRLSKKENLRKAYYAHLVNTKTARNNGRVGAQKQQVREHGMFRRFVEQTYAQQFEHTYKLIGYDAFARVLNADAQRQTLYRQSESLYSEAGVKLPDVEIAEIVEYESAKANAEAIARANTPEKPIVPPVNRILPMGPEDIVETESGDSSPFGDLSAYDWEPLTFEQDYDTVDLPDNIFYYH